MKKIFLVLLLLMVVSYSTKAAYKNIVIGTDFSQWNDVPVFYTDATGDISEAAFDCKEVKIANNNSSLFINYSTVGNLEISSNGFAYHVFFDVDSSPTTGFTNTWFSNGYDYMIEGATLYGYTGSGSDWSWTNNYGLQNWGSITNLFQIGSAKSFFNTNTIVFLDFGTNSHDFIPDVESNAATYDFSPPQPPTGYYANISINGNFSDWADIPVFYTDPTGDVAEADYDCEIYKTANNRSSLFLYYEMRGTITAFGWPYQTFVDSDNDPLTGFNGGWMTHGYDYLIQGSWYFPFNGGTNQSLWSWDTSATVYGSHAFTGNKVELNVPRSAFGEEIVLLGMMGTNVSDFIPDSEADAKVYAMAPSPPPPSYFADIIVDGSVGDWFGIPPVFIDGTNDYYTNGVPLNVPDYDITDIYMANNEDLFFVRVDVNGLIDPSLFGFYFLMLDTDTNANTGLNYGWWSIGVDRRSILTDWVGINAPTGIVQEFMGINQSDDTWGWAGTINSTQVENTWCAFSSNTVEFGLPRIALDNLSNNFTLCNYIIRTVDSRLGGDGDAAPYFNASPEYYMTAPVPEPVSIYNILFIIYYLLIKKFNSKN